MSLLLSLLVLSVWCTVLCTGRWWTDRDDGFSNWCHRSWWCDSSLITWTRQSDAVRPTLVAAHTDHYVCIVCVFVPWKPWQSASFSAHPSTASEPTSYYSMWHYNCQCPLKAQAPARKSGPLCNDAILLFVYLSHLFLPNAVWGSAGGGFMCRLQYTCFVYQKWKLSLKIDNNS